ncbi:MAG: SDR family NAD(P)-dependent oxidoreductase, partial [Alphaproteobacteria bacterium]|nr:SDR family NAD(P)-dependent oxidoreductase [Alphaproteobacteria bacterium]
VPPVADIQDPVLDIYKDAMKNSPASWIGYLSATSVYGNHDGAWVDEASLCVPDTPKAMLRLQSEEQWQALYHQHGKPVHIFRLAGIYGPFQNTLVHLKNGKRDTIVKPGHYFSRIHVADICKGLVASMEQPQPWAIYNMADDEPAPLHVVQQYGAKLLDLPQLTETLYNQAHLSPGMREFFENNKRVCAKKIKQDLNVSWTYPTYREGLKNESGAV